LIDTPLGTPSPEQQRLSSTDVRARRQVKQMHDRTHQRYYGDDDGYVVRRSYGYYGGPGYYDRGYGSYGGGPSIGFSFGTRSW
jgi:hypothetical protein